MGEVVLPFKTWYVRSPATADVSIDAVMPPGVARNVLNAALLGANIVMFCAVERVFRREG
jgi:hypothetical protein